MKNCKKYRSRIVYTAFLLAGRTGGSAKSLIPFLFRACGVARRIGFCAGILFLGLLETKGQDLADSKAVYVRQDSRAVLDSAAGKQVAPLTWKRGDAAELVVRFVNASGVVQEPTAGTGVLFMAKLPGSLGGPALISATGSKEGTGTSTLYRFTINTNTTELLTAIRGANARTLTLACELEWQIGSATPRSSQSFALVILDDVRKGNEGVPTSANPPYPAASLLLTIDMKAVANGLATLDGTGKIPLSQLPDDLGGDVAWDDVTGKPSTFPPSSHTHPSSAITDKGAPNGVASLDGDGKVPEAQLPDLGGGFDGTYEGTLIVRKPGGTPDEEELQISHDGTNATLQNKKSGKAVIFKAFITDAWVTAEGVWVRPDTGFWFSSDGDPNGFYTARASLVAPTMNVVRLDGSGTGAALRLRAMSGDAQAAIGTPPGGAAEIRAKDVAGTTQLVVINDAGTETQISPHAKDAPAWLYDAADADPLVVREDQPYLGRIKWTNASRRDRLTQRLINGENLTALPAQARTIIAEETYAEYQARTGAVMLKRDWDADQAKQQELQAERIAKVEAFKQQLIEQGKIEEAAQMREEAPYQKKQKPDFLRDKPPAEAPAQAEAAQLAQPTKKKGTLK
jgi:hypothetical protein